MKKMKFLMFAVAFVAAFVFTSCLNSDNDSNSNTFMSLCTVEHATSGVVFYPDESPKQMLVPTNATNDFDNAKRAVISYSLVEGQDTSSPTLKIVLTSNSGAVKMSKFTTVKDTLSAYNGAFIGFVDYVVGYYTYHAVNVAKGRYLNVGYNYYANKVGNTAMYANHVSNDTIYLDLLIKKEGNAYTSGNQLNCYDLQDITTLHSLGYEKIVPKQDSIYVTVKINSPEFVQPQGSNREESRTVRVPVL
ncbi:hypothetical protein [Phocaeicola oris]|uniref:hypothetical protein n=1 Tax=Phocaeicola oris TaxID=2896850 RepID=UPI00234E4BA5|nr:hypothetical protein [Phocaeicola oris]MCE2616703.1 hypothetical protein [Phocaeicola oris]